MDNNTNNSATNINTMSVSTPLEISTTPNLTGVNTNAADMGVEPSSKGRLIALIIVLLFLSALAGAAYMYKDTISDLMIPSSGEPEVVIKVNTKTDMNSVASQNDNKSADVNKESPKVESSSDTPMMINATSSTIATSSPASTTSKMISLVKGYTASIVIKYAKVIVTINDEVFLDKDSSNTFTSMSGGLTNLKKGNNKVIVKYTKSDDSDTDMVVIVEVKKYSKLVLTLSPKNNKNKEGILEGNIIVP